MPINSDIFATAQLREPRVSAPDSSGAAPFADLPTQGWLHGEALAPWPDPIAAQDELCSRRQSSAGVGAPTHVAAVQQSTVRVPGDAAGRERGLVAGRTVADLQDVLQDILQQLSASRGGDELHGVCHSAEWLADPAMLPDFAEHEERDRSGCEKAHADWDCASLGVERAITDSMAEPSRRDRCGRSHFPEGELSRDQAVAPDMARALDDFFHLQAAARSSGPTWCP